jgi:hypothetical protein
MMFKTAKKLIGLPANRRSQAEFAWEIIASASTSADGAGLRCA